MELDVRVAIENRTNSHYWNVESTTKIRSRFGDNFVTFHPCAHGGTRDKSTSIWQSHKFFDSLELKCDKKHKDGKSQISPWRRRHTRIDYERIVACVMTQVFTTWSNFDSDISTTSSFATVDTAEAHCYGDVANVATKSNLLVSEFQRYETMHCDPQQQSE